MIVKIETSQELIEAMNALAHALNNLSASLNIEAEKVVEKDEQAEAEKSAEVSLEDVRAKLAALAKEGKQEEVKNLITSYGASKLTEIPAEKYAELLEKAEAIA